VIAKIVEVDASTAPDELLEQLYVVHDEGGRELLGGAPAPTLAERVARYRNPGPYSRRRWLAYVEGEPAGIGSLEVFGPAFCMGDVMVRPRFRRRGIGRELFRVVCDSAREQGVEMFFGHHGSAVGAAFAAAVGAQDDQRDVKSALRLRDAVLPEPAAPAGIELRTWLGPVPDDLIETFVLARAAMNDAPTPGGGADLSWTPERQRADDAALVARGTPPHTTVALDGDQVVALTGIRVKPAPCAYVTTDDTAVVPSHRGRGIAYALKLENLRRLREERPDVELVGTMNAEHNAAMRAVNTKLGFVPVITLTTALVRLAAG
jgi:GNAT superfamily N-acetyltransferase